MQHFIDVICKLQAASKSVWKTDSCQDNYIQGRERRTVLWNITVTSDLLVELFHCLEAGYHSALILLLSVDTIPSLMHFFPCA